MVRVFVYMMGSQGGCGCSGDAGVGDSGEEDEDDGEGASSGDHGGVRGNNGAAIEGLGESGDASLDEEGVGRRVDAAACLRARLLGLSPFVETRLRFCKRCFVCVRLCLGPARGSGAGETLGVPSDGAMDGELGKGEDDEDVQ